MTHTTRRFSELRAEDVESNLFQYHLKHLIGKRLVEKTDHGYQLTPQGLYYADRFSPAYKGERPQPKLITVIALKDCNGRVLLQQKGRQPWLGEYHMPAGKIHSGESTPDAAVRELYEKTGITLVALEFRATAHVQIYKQGEMVSDYYAFIFGGRFDGNAANTYWLNVDDDASGLKLAPGVRELLRVEADGSREFHQFTVDA